MVRLLRYDHRIIVKDGSQAVPPLLLVRTPSGLPPLPPKDTVHRGERGRSGSQSSGGSSRLCRTTTSKDEHVYICTNPRCQLIKPLRLSVVYLFPG